MKNATKEELRVYLKSRLLRLADGDASSISVTAVENLKRILKENTGIRSVLLYKPVKKWHEIDVSSLPGLLPEKHFEFVENAKNASFPTKTYDCIVVPLLGFTKNGYRLGHGGGWYDRFLETQPQALKIGVGYESGLVEFKTEPHDIPMDVVITALTQDDSHGNPVIKTIDFIGKK